jgi:hypothetical protein
MGDAFLLFGVFHDFERVNREVVVEVFAEPRGGGGASWVRVDAALYVPVPPAERDRRLWADARKGDLSFRSADEARAFFGRKLMDRFERLEPGRRALAVRVASLTWPRRRGSYGPVDPGEVTSRILYEVQR